MALLFADSFDHYGTGSIGNNNMLNGQWAAVLSSGGPTTAQSRTGNRSFFSCNFESNNTVIARRLLGSSVNEIGIAMGVYYPSLPTNLGRPSYEFVQGTTAIISYYVTPDGSIRVHRGTPSGVLLGETDNGIITAAAWHHVEVRMLRDNIVGEVEIRVNGILELLLSNLDLGTTDATGFQLIKRSAGTWTSYIDDIIAWDTTGDINNTFFGPARVNTVFMSADTDIDDWSVTGAATGAEAIDETTPDGDTTYVSAAIVGQRSEFVPGELPPEVEVIGGVYIPAMAKLASAGLGNFQLSIVSNGEVATGPDRPLTTAYTYWPSIFEKDPDGNKVWSKAAFEAARIRIEKTA